MSVPTGAGNYPPGVTDNDPHFESDPDNLEVSLEHPGALSNLPHDEECRHNEGGIRGGYCTDCGELVDADAAAEAAWERQQNDGEAFRGKEWAAYQAEEQEKARRLK